MANWQWKTWFYYSALPKTGFLSHALARGHLGSTRQGAHSRRGMSGPPVCTTFQCMSYSCFLSLLLCKFGVFSWEIHPGAFISQTYYVLSATLPSVLTQSHILMKQLWHTTILKKAQGILQLYFRQGYMLTMWTISDFSYSVFSFQGY